MEPAGWIGDYDAFVAFQAAFEADRRGADERLSDTMDRDAFEDIRIAVRMRNAMRAVIDDPAFPSVGETAISLLSRNSLFEYGAAAYMYAGLTGQTIPPHQWTPLQFGDAAVGGFSYTVLTPAQPGVGAIGLYFLQGSLGLLYAPLITRDAEPYRNVSQDEFARQVLIRHGLEFAPAIGFS